MDEHEQSLLLLHIKGVVALVFSSADGDALLFGMFIIVCLLLYSYVGFVLFLVSFL